MENGGDAGSRLVHQVILDIPDHLAYSVGLLVLGTRRLADVPDSVWEYLAAFLKGNLAVHHQIAGVDAIELGSLLFKGQAVIDRIHQFTE